MRFFMVRRDMSASVFVKRRKRGQRESDDGSLVTSRRGGGEILLRKSFGVKFVFQKREPDEPPRQVVNTLEPSVFLYYCF